MASGSGTNTDSTSSSSSGTQNYGAQNVAPNVSVGNTGLNLGAILLPFQANPANGGMGINPVSRWLDDNYPVESAAPSVPSQRILPESVENLVPPILIGSVVLLVGALILIRRKGVQHGRS